MLKVLMYVGYPIDYAHGGHRDQILNTVSELKKNGVHVDWLHNERQNLKINYDIVHFWTFPNQSTLDALKSKLTAKFVWSTMMPTAGRKSQIYQNILRSIVNFAHNIDNPRLRLVFPQYSVMDTLIVLNELEKQHYSNIWSFNYQNIFVIPNGIDECFFNNHNDPIQFDGVIQIGAITDIKNSIEVAVVAKKAGIKVKFIGDFRLNDEDYKIKFINEVDDKYVYWEGPVNNKYILAKHIIGCKGVIQPSKWEAYPLVVSEALALKQQVLLTDLPNLRNIFKDNVYYCSDVKCKLFVKQLYEFANRKNIKTNDFIPYSWEDVARQILNAYNSTLTK